LWLRGLQPSASLLLRSTIRLRVRAAALRCDCDCAVLLRWDVHSSGNALLRAAGRWGLAFCKRRVDRIAHGKVLGIPLAGDPNALVQFWSELQPVLCPTSDTNVVRCLELLRRLYPQLDLVPVFCELPLPVLAAVNGAGDALFPDLGDDRARSFRSLSQDSLTEALADAPRRPVRSSLGGGGIGSVASIAYVVRDLLCAAAVYTCVPHAMSSAARRRDRCRCAWARAGHSTLPLCSDSGRSCFWRTSRQWGCSLACC
jgi:hypothetical protein